jgi:hypothetical protein
MKDLIEFLQQPMPEFPTLAWRFAKAMQEHPHAYVVRSPGNEDDDVKLFHLVGKDGVWESLDTLVLKQKVFVDGPGQFTKIVQSDVL